MAGNKGQVDVIISQLAIDNIAKANTALEKTLQTILAVNKASRGGSGGSSPNDAEKINKANKASTERLKLADQTLILNKKLVQSQIALGNATGKTADQIAKNKVELQEANKKLKERAKLSLGLVGAYAKESKRLNDLRKKYKDLAISEGKSTKKTKEMRLEITKLDAKLKKVDASVGQFQRSVGNYSKGMRGAMGAARGLASAMGLVGGAFLIVKVIRDAARRIKEFDKVMQNLSGILGENRKDLKSLEKRIIDVAGASIKTSNEVAKLAETLITLGKTKSEVEDLLEPVNNLSIGLEATSQEAGELLVQTLNAFGESSKEAQRYADIIAKMRTSTALDFQRIKDALGFLAPVAKAAGVSFEETGAILGVLVDNGIKAARAGRLMSTTFLKLAAEGKTLEEALDAINKAQADGVSQTDLLSLASKTFGKQSAALGLILANNRDRVSELTGEFENAQGTLKELTDKQLESLDAKLKILDSSWEKFVLSIEKGDGKMSAFFKKTTEFLSEFLEGLALANKEPLSLLGVEDQAFEQKLVSAKEKFEELIRIKKQFGESTEGITFLDELEFNFIEVQKRLEDASLTVNRFGEGGAEKVAKLKGEVRALAKLIKEEKLNPLDANGDGKGDTAEVAKKTIAFYEEIIRVARENARTTATNSDEYAVFTKKIDDATASIDRLKNGFKELIAVQSAPTSGAFEVGGGTSPSLGGFDPAPRDTGGGGDGGGQTGLQEAAGNASAILNSEVFIAAEETFFALVDLGDMLFERRIAHIDAEIQANEEKYKMLFLLAEGDEEQQRLLAIEKEKKEQELLKKKRKEQKKQAIFNKAAAIIQIGINTAIAVTSQLSLPVAGFALAALAAAAGAASIATVIASPIPQFAKGGTMDHDGLAVVGDGGRKEVIKNPDGSLQVTPSTSTLVGLQKGAEIFPSIDAFNKEVPNDIGDKIYSATVMASLAINKAEMKGYFDSKKIMDDKLLEAMLMNTEAIKKQKLRVNTSSQRIDLADELYKMKYS